MVNFPFLGIKLKFQIYLKYKLKFNLLNFFLFFYLFAEDAGKWEATINTLIFAVLNLQQKTIKEVCFDHCSLTAN